MKQRSVLVSLLCGLLLLLFGAQPVAAMWLSIPLGELVQESDKIARVQVLHNRRNPQVETDWYKREAADTIRKSHGWIATARVIDPIYGAKKGEIIRIYNDNDAGGCPGLGYAGGEDTTVFLERHTDGTHTTVNWTNGSRATLSPAKYAALKAEIKSELVKLSSPRFTGLRGEALHAERRAEYERYECIMRFRNLYRNTTGEWFPLLYDIESLTEQTYRASDKTARRIVIKTAPRTPRL